MKNVENESFGLHVKEVTGHPHVTVSPGSASQGNVLTVADCLRRFFPCSVCFPGLCRGSYQQSEREGKQKSRERLKQTEVLIQSK